MPVSYDFEGRVAIVTGGAKGIGRRIAERLRDAGADVCVWDLAPARLRRRVPRRGGRDRPGLDRSRRRADRRGGPAGPHPRQQRRLRRVEHAGARVRPRRLAADRRGEPRQRLRGLPAGRSADAGGRLGPGGQHGVARRQGRDAVDVGLCGGEGGVIAFTKAFGKELAATDIRVNCVAPAAIDTDILRQLSPEAVRRMIEISPMKRLGTVEEVAEVVLFLCSEGCSFSTGAAYDASGGRAVY